MVIWKSFGVSVIGPGHVRAGLPNQDAFALYETPTYDALVVSDGVGSAANADVGSKMVCEAVCEALEQWAAEDRVFESAPFVADVKERFLVKIAPLAAEDCAATCLYAIRLAGRIDVGLLGDGVAAVERRDGTFVFLSDDKAEGFLNVVSAFAQETCPDNWRTFSLPEDICEAVVLCTDGISGDLVDVEGFMRAFIAEYSAKDVSASASEIETMLTNWPTPKHSDDKTIACLFRKEVSLESH